MIKTLEMFPTHETLKGQCWTFESSMSERLCRVYDQEKTLIADFPFEAADSVIKMPEFAGNHRWPVLNIANASAEFKFDKEGMRYLKLLELMCLTLKDKTFLLKQKLKCLFWMFVGLVMILGGGFLATYVLMLPYVSEHSGERGVIKVIALLLAIPSVGVWVFYNCIMMLRKIRKAEQIQTQANS